MSEVIILSSDDDEATAGKTSEGKSSSAKIKRNRNHKEDPSFDCNSEVNNVAGFKKFLDFCAEIEVNKRGGSVRAMNVIKEKLLSRYNAADPEYTKSKAFDEIVSLARKKVEKDPTNLFVHMKQVVDELKVRSMKKRDEANKRKIAESEDEPQSKRVKEETEVSEEETSKEMKINERHVEKLERLFHKVYRKVKKLGEKEVDWDDDDDSAYLKWQRYEKRLYLIWEKWQEARGHVDEVKRLKSKRIAFAGTKFSELNKAIENFVNKTRRFPDFHDILKLTTETLNKNDEKHRSSDQLHNIASDAFRSLGNQLQKRRVIDFWNSFLTYLPSETNSSEELVDPAEEDETLARLLQENQRQNEKKMNEVLTKFVDEQITQKLEPEEVPPSVEDENSKSGEDNKEEGDEVEEDDEEEEDPEDIIAISSSSEESDAEADGNAEENGTEDDGHYENGVAGDTKELKMEDVNEVNEKANSVKDKSETCSADLLSAEKSKSKIKDIEPIASCSYSQSKSKVKEKSNNSTHCDVILLESD